MNEDIAQALVVDDEIDLRESLVELIASEGFHVALAGDGEDAIELLRSGAAEPDVVFLDLRMPKKDGLEHTARRHGLSLKVLSDEAMRCLMAYAFPGNVRELENIIERAVITAGAAVEVLSPAHLFGEDAETIGNESRTNRPFLDLPFKEAVAALERELIQRALEASDGNRAEAARRLGINRRLLYSKMEEHKIQ